MSLPNSVNQPVEKQRTNIYTMMLIISFIALVTGSIISGVYFEQLKKETGSDAPWNTSAMTPKAPT